MKGISISATCQLFGVNRQVYYREKSRVTRNRNKATLVMQLVNHIRADMPRIGTRKLHHILHEELSAIGVGRDKLFSILRANQSLIQPVRSYHVTTNSNHRFRKYKNLISDTIPTRPEQIIASDITYIGGRDRHLYLSLVTDVYSKKILGYDLSDNLNTQSVLKSLKMAHKNRIYPDMDLIHHSDRGIQYCSEAYQKALRKYNMTPSMTECYDPYANAVAERVNGILKQEFLIEQVVLPLETMRLLIKDVIEIYNHRRPHSSCKFLTPEQMHNQSIVKIKTYKSDKNNRAKKYCTVG